jgi:predicted dehydrogenase
MQPANVASLPEEEHVVKIGIMSFAHMHGAGYAAAVKALPGCQLAGVADEDEKRGRKMAERFDTAYFDSFEALCDGDADGVVISSDNKMHLPLTLIAAARGKHILCEKPIARTLAEARAMVSAAEKAGVILGTAFPCRFIPAVTEARQMIAGGRLSAILAIRGTNRGTMPGGWFIDAERSGGGAVIDHTVHVADLMRWLTGSEVREVYAEIDMRFHDIGIDDTGMLSMAFENGVIATLDASWSRPPKSFPTWGDVTMKLVAGNGTVEIDSFNQKVDFYSEADGKAHDLYFGDNIDAGLVANFAAAIRGDETISATGHDGLKALEIALGAYQSASRKAPVTLPLRE